MLNPSVTQLLVQPRVEEIHRAARNDGHSRRLSATAGEIDGSPAAALAGGVARAITRAFDGARSPDDEAAATYGFELLGHSSSATWSRR